MRTLAIDIILTIVCFGGLMLPLCGWIWIALCKYVLHFHRKCNNHNCWFRCRKCPPLHSEQLEKRIALLEQKYPSDHAYIGILKRQLKMYLDNPALDRETEDEMFHRLVREEKERNG